MEDGKHEDEIETVLAVFQLTDELYFFDVILVLMLCL